MCAQYYDPKLFNVITTDFISSDLELNPDLYPPTALITDLHNQNISTHGCMGRHAFLKGVLMTLGCCLLFSVVITLFIVRTTDEDCSGPQKQSVNYHCDSSPWLDGALFGLLGVLSLCAALTAWHCCRKKCTVNTHDNLTLLPLIEPVV